MRKTCNQLNYYSICVFTRLPWPLVQLLQSELNYAARLIFGLK